ncbi:MAG: hypothetical protein QOJ45_800 [Verrucomicrobiota bacterium]|jgi:hypothetical protein
MRSGKRPSEPWDSFFKDLDSFLNTPTRLDCIGGFVVSQLYGLNRPTADVDFIELARRDVSDAVMLLAQRGGPLSRRHLIYLDRVGVAAVPENYESRLIEMFPGAWKHLRLMALDPYDLALSKLERNSQKDRDDVRFLARTVPLDLNILQQRYRNEFRWQLGVPAREDLTLQLWTEVILEDRAEGSDKTET